MSAKKNKFAKFAKFGIVLLSTVTIATVAQSQQGNVSHRVYAEEVSQPDYDSWRMFYVHSADYPNDPNDGGMAGRVITPDVPYVVGNESFRAPGTYSRYEVFDDTGKRYNPGDTITVNDPVVNHANEEDNNIYYYYYMNSTASETPAPAPSTSPSTSEAPAPSTSPSTSEAPAPSTSPSTSEAPSASEAAKPAVEKPSQKADDKTTATDKAKNAKAKVENSKDATSEKTVAAKDNSTSKTAEASAPAEQAKASVKANTNVPSEIVKEADGTVDTAAVHNDSGKALLTVLGLVSAAFIGLFKNKKEEK